VQIPKSRAEDLHIIGFINPEEQLSFGNNEALLAGLQADFLFAGPPLACFARLARAYGANPSCTVEHHDRRANFQIAIGSGTEALVELACRWIYLLPEWRQNQ